MWRGAISIHMHAAIGAVTQAPLRADLIDEKVADFIRNKRADGFG